MGIEAHYGEQELAQRGEIAAADLEKSLDNWISYLSDANEPYPTWFRYYAFRNVLDLGDYDKDKGEFTKRSRGSARLFPDIDRGALAYVEQMIEAAKDPEMLERLRKAQETTGTPPDQLLTKEKAAQFSKFSFSKQYVEGIRQAGEITPEMREETRWPVGKIPARNGPHGPVVVAPKQGRDLVHERIRNGRDPAQGQRLLRLLHSRPAGQTNHSPRRDPNAGKNIGEVRGVADNNQNLEGNMAEIAEEKMKDLPGAERYKKVSADMKALTAIEKKTMRGEALMKDDLAFLYELDAPIEGFGYRRDPRIGKLRGKRNPEEDAPVVFECTPEQIARNVKEIREGTKAYVAPPRSRNLRQDPGIRHRTRLYVLPRRPNQERND